jgi:hypothetical protein
MAAGTKNHGTMTATTPCERRSILRIVVDRSAYDCKEEVRNVNDDRPQARAETSIDGLDICTTRQSN